MFYSGLQLKAPSSKDTLTDTRRIMLTHHLGTPGPIKLTIPSGEHCYAGGPSGKNRNPKGRMALLLTWGKFVLRP